MSKFFGVFILILFFSLAAEAKQTNTLNPAINKQIYMIKLGNMKKKAGN